MEGWGDGWCIGVMGGAFEGDGVMGGALEGGGGVMGSALEGVGVMGGGVMGGPLKGGGGDGGCVGEAPIPESSYHQQKPPCWCLSWVRCQAWA